MGQALRLRPCTPHPIGRHQALTAPLFRFKRLMLQAFCDKRLITGYKEMKTSTAHSRLESLQLAAEECLSRDEAQKILRKADKAHAKLESSAAPFHRPKN